MNAKKKTAWDAVKGFAIELVVEQDQGQPKESSNKQFAIELAIYAALVVSYVFLVFTFFGNRLPDLFDQHKRVYAVVGLALIVSQGVVLEVIAVALEKFVRKLK
jgi:hypothetical protein